MQICPFLPLIILTIINIIIIAISITYYVYRFSEPKSLASQTIIAFEWYEFSKDPIPKKLDEQILVSDGKKSQIVSCHAVEYTSDKKPYLYFKHHTLTHWAFLPIAPKSKIYDKCKADLQKEIT